VQAGLFTASPQAYRPTSNGTVGYMGTQAIGQFDNVTLQGGWSQGPWGQCEVGAAQLSVGSACAGPSAGPTPGAVTQAGSSITVSGTGDISPYEPIPDIIGGVAKGALAGLVALIALGGVFIGSEYRRGMIRMTFAGTPRRGLVVLAKAIVIGVVAFIAALPGAAIAIAIAGPKVHSEGWTSPIYPLVSLGSATGIRIVVGTAVLLALAAMFSLAVGVILRRSVGAITVGIALFVGPLLIAAVVSQTAGSLLLRVTPAAAFAVQQGVQRYPQSSAVCLASHGCYPLSPWNGVAVLAAWTVAALLVGWVVVSRRDA
jgi:hypothetical protein